jgi:hypothetical protein
MHNSIGSMFMGLRRRSAGLLLPVATAAFMYALASPAHASAPRGTFVIFDIPGGARDVLPDGINPSGAITGSYDILVNDNVVYLGFLRKPDGSIITFGVPGSISTFVGSPFLASAAHPSTRPGPSRDPTVT